MPKDKRIQLRLTQEERDELASISKIHGFKSTSEYLRHVALKRSLSSSNKDLIIQEIQQIINLLQSLIYKIKNI